MRVCESVCVCVCEDLLWTLALLSCAAGPVSTLGLDYLPTSATSASSDSSWHQIGPAGSSWTNQESPMEESSVLLDSLKVGSPEQPGFCC